MATPTLRVLVSTTGVSIVPSSSTCVEPASLPKALPTNTAPGTLSWNRLPAMREHRGDAGAHAAAFHERHVADAHASDVGDRVQRTRREHTRLDAQITRAGTGHCCARQSLSAKTANQQRG